MEKPITYYGLGEIKLPFGVILAFCILIGVILTLALVYGEIFKLKREVKLKDKTIEKMEKELTNLRDLPMTEVEVEKEKNQ